MKILFVRHGESEDDIVNAYGGWIDWPLTTKGVKQIQTTAEKISQLDTQFSKILSSPLKRALSTSNIISKRLGIPQETFEYVKERNTYGILSGMLKDTAKQKYPDQVAKLENNEYVDGSERIEDISSRIEKALQILRSKNEDIIVVTHGNFLKVLMPILLNKNLTKKEDGGYILIEMDGEELPRILTYDGIEVE